MNVVVVSINHMLNVRSAVPLMGITLPDQKATRRVAELTLQNLGIDPADVSRIKSVPYDTLRKAGDAAIAQAKSEGLAVYSWSPVVDGDYIPSDPVEGGFSDWAKDIPMMVGSCLNEWVPVPLIFDDVSEVSYGHDRELRRLLAE